MSIPGTFTLLLLAGMALASTPPDWQLKNVVIDRDYVFPDGEHMRGRNMDEALKRVFKPESIDEFFDPEVQYYLTDTIAESNKGYIFLILKDDPNEVIGWVVIYTLQMQVEHQLEVYYENAEGNYYLSSEIRNNEIISTGDNIVPEPNPISHFTIEGMRWKQLKKG